MICSSSDVPSVAVTSAWVSPRVKSAEPWVRGRKPTSHSMWRISSPLRPSWRVPSRVSSRNAFFAVSSKYDLTGPTVSGFVAASGANYATQAFFTAS